MPTSYRDTSVSADEITSSSGRNVIAVVGIDRYRSWPRLANAAHDSRGAVTVFQRLGFESITTHLLDDAATGRAIHTLVTDELQNLRPDDSLVLFYAGHGATRKHYLGPNTINTGYLVPVDALSETTLVETRIPGIVRAHPGSVRT